MRPAESTPTMHAQQLMTYPAVSIPSDLSSAEALLFAKKERFHHLPVERDGTLIGLVCTCDLRELQADAPVSEGLKRGPVIVSPGDTTQHIAKIMQKECVSSVLVRDSGGWGIVTKDDLLEAQPEDPTTLELIEACRCMYCDAREHLRRHNETEMACVDCLERAREPQRFEGGVVD